MSYLSAETFWSFLFLIFMRIIDKVFYYNIWLSFRPCYKDFIFYVFFLIVVINFIGLIGIIYLILVFSPL